MVALTASSFTSTTLAATAVSSAVLYQRNATNVIGATAATGTNIGTLITNSSQLDVTGQVAPQNQTNYYNFALQGNSLKLDAQNLTGSATLRIQVLDSSGKVVADNAGTQAQQTAYGQLNSSGGLNANAGNYTLAVSYAPGQVTANAQNYSLSLYSGALFDSSYETTAAAQTSTSQHVAVDNTNTYATNDAQLYSTQQYNKINATAETAINVGWLYQNKTALSVQSQVTNSDQNDYYGFTFEKGSAIKLAFDNSTDTTGLRVQLLDSSGTEVIADSNGTAAQQKAYAALTSSSGLNASGGQYVVKVSYDQTANKSKAQTYDFSLYSGTSYSTLDKTTASAETYGHAVLAGDLGTTSYNAATAAATYLFNQSQGTTTDALTVLENLGSSAINSSALASILTA